MRLKARLKRLEAQVDWLDTFGELILAEQELEFLLKKKELEDYLADHPQKAAILAAAGVTCVRPTPRPVARPSPSPKPAPNPAPKPAPEPLPEPRAEPPSNPAAAAPAPEPRPPPVSKKSRPDEVTCPEAMPVVPEATDIPEHMQIRPVFWRASSDYEDVRPRHPEDEDYDPIAAFYDEE
ncbi:hypothetical protein SAMN02745126_00835 [Enhydrobacter aerosaccus]|uniref:Uncharacterized protein n=1 Tax=Enhydrobacter aerosaccus TaxID=225324 RepID=A0A1T4K9T7_9HYPH|nr:hypothetical protein [Enhydrobacter aerosaccus]SJZ39210.1 hypothetical protein SAMN02745126_00835 [Enhydrobacter aerosaccus]